MDNDILTVTDGAVCTITINRPEKKNPLSNATYLQIKAALEDAANNRAVRVVLIRGAGGVFSAGNDMKDFAQSANAREERDVMASGAAQLMQTWLSFEKPIVAAVNGFAIGFGATCLLHCDSVIAGQSTIFRLPFTSLGVVPEFGCTYTLPFAAGKAKASHYLLTAEAFDAQTAHDLGMVSIVCEDDRVDDIALATCKKLATLPPSAIRATKRLINREAQRKELLRVVTDELHLFRAGTRSAEHREAVSAFIEKRPADFSSFE